LVVLTSTADAGPWPIFDALHAGVPVVALPVGWATTLLTDGQAGRLVEDAAALAAAVPAMLAEREAWRTRRATVRARVAGFGFDAWLRTNLQLAAELARPAVHHAA
jgi:glycosyltransferase involved in cell wall biosynthesis